MSRTEFVLLKDRFPRFVDSFMQYAPPTIFFLAGVVFVILSIKGVVGFRHLFWLVPVSTAATLVLLMLAWSVLEVLFLGLCYTWNLVFGMLKEWRQQGEHFFVIAYGILFLVLLVSFLWFCLRGIDGSPLS